MMPNCLVKVDVIAKRLNVPESWVYQAAADGTLPSYKIGSYRRFDIAEIDEYLRRQRQGGDAS